MSFPIQDYDFTKTANHILMWLEYRPFASTGVAYVQFSVKETGEVLGSKSVNIPEDIYSTWTDSDEVLVNYVTNQLGITIKSE